MIRATMRPSIKHHTPKGLPEWIGKLPEHYKKSELLLWEANRRIEREYANAGFRRSELIQESGVHATLALAAATALGRIGPEYTMLSADRSAWIYAASEQPGEKRRQREADAEEAAEAALEVEHHG